MHPLWRDVIAAGVRAAFEMEHVIPGDDPDDWDAEPIGDAVDLHHAGRHRDAVVLLERLVADDRRCVDAWAHLGLVAFNTQGLGRARPLYETGVASGEAPAELDRGRIGLHGCRLARPARFVGFARMPRRGPHSHALDPSLTRRDRLTTVDNGETLDS